MALEEVGRVLLCACEQLVPYLKVNGLDALVVESLSQVFNSSVHTGLRAIVIGEDALSSKHMDGVVKRCRECCPMVDVILWMPSASRDLVRTGLNCGAKDVLFGRSESECAKEIAHIIEAQQLLPRASQHEEQHEGEHVFEGIYARSRIMWDLFETASQVAATDATVLVLGETGTGKELLARAIHRISRRSGRFVPLNCGAINETLVDSELFGHVKGAFTGAHTTKEGLFSHADHGTLFLDEIGNVPLTAQYHLLRTLQEGTIRPVGSHTEVSVDVRVIAATSNELTEDVIQGKFREDLLYRLDVIRLEIPPLRERQDDLIFLFAHFARKISAEYNVSRPDLTDGFLDALGEYPWHGNVRELQNFTERLILTQTGQRLQAEDFHQLITPNYRHPRSEKGSRIKKMGADELSENDALSIDVGLTLKENLEQVSTRVEKRYLEQCLKKTGGKVGDSAKLAGISRRTLLRKMNHYDLDKMSYREKKAR